MADSPPLLDASGRRIVANIIHGKPSILPDSSSFPVVNAQSGEVLYYAQSATPDVANAAVEAAAETFQSYKKTSIVERRQLLVKAAELFDKRTDQFSERIAMETSAAKAVASGMHSLAAGWLREAAAAISSAITGEIQPSARGCTNLVFKEAIGPVMVIAPWNAATSLAVRGIGGALAAGCTVVFKASELCPWTHQDLVHTFIDAGFPSGCVNMIVADRSSGPSITEKVIAHDKIRKIEFIGSAQVGRIIASVAACHLKPVLLELGDKSPAIILPDADLEKAAEMCLAASNFHAGQICFSTERILVYSTVRDAFMKCLSNKWKGDPTGCSISREAASKAQDMIDEALAGGAELVLGPVNISQPPYVGSYVLSNVPQSARLFQEEAFAPIISLTTFEREEEAIREANSRNGGLSASIFTQNWEKALRLSRELDFGQIEVNNMTMNVETTGPVTGTKGSGWGSNGGCYGIREFLVNKIVYLTPESYKLPASPC